MQDMTFYAAGERNYTALYDKSTYTSSWVAYPLAKGHTDTGRDGSWSKTPGLDIADQINIWTSSYGVNYGSTTSDGYNDKEEFYARGHQIPNADRNGSGYTEMQKQTFYSVNSTPQIQNKFNAGIWNSLETAVRGVIPASDTLYVATGAVLRTVGGSETVTYIHAKNDAAKDCPVPNYYYKVLLKVKRDGSGNITDAATIGFWLRHEPYTDGGSWPDYAVSVDEIERRTGFDFFANLPEAIQNPAEQNSSWSAFQSF